jgi:hypothetical protein
MSEDSIRAAVADALRLHGVPATAARLKLSPEACLRIAAGLPVRRGTLALAEHGVSATLVQSIAAGPRLGETP